MVAMKMLKKTSRNRATRAAGAISTRGTVVSLGQAALPAMVTMKSNQKT